MKNTKNTVISSLFVLSLITGCSTSNVSQPVTQDNNATNVQSLAASNDFDAQGISKTKVLVKLKNNNTNGIQTLSEKYSTRVKRTIPKINVLVMEVPEGQTSQEFIKSLSSDSKVAYAEPDVKVELDDVDEVKYNDPMIGDQYALTKVEAAKAWAINAGSESVIIGAIDTGVDLNHPDLKGKLLPGYNAITPGADPMDDSRHGTHTGGIAGGISNNGLGIAGLGGKAKILPVKVLGANSGSISSIADGLIWAADHGADVVNMSLGTYTEEKTLGDAVKYALSKNVVCIATMGNDNVERMRYPAAFPGMIAVGSTDENDKKSSFSNFGSWITVSAPGSNILSTLPTTMSPNGYGKLSGTSMAAPLVTGLAALIRSQHPKMTPANVAKIIKESADDLGDKGFDKNFGAGRINAFKALTLSAKMK